MIAPVGRAFDLLRISALDGADSLGESSALEALPFRLSGRYSSKISQRGAVSATDAKRLNRIDCQEAKQLTFASRPQSLSHRFYQLAVVFSKYNFLTLRYNSPPKLFPIFFKFHKISCFMRGDSSLETILAMTSDDTVLDTA